MGSPDGIPARAGMTPCVGKGRVRSLPLLVTHQKAASPLQAPGTSVLEAPLCIIQRLVRADPRPPCQPALEVRQQMWRGHPALAPRSGSIPTAERHPASRSQGLAALATFAFGAPSNWVSQPRSATARRGTVEWCRLPPFFPQNKRSRKSVEWIWYAKRNRVLRRFRLQQSPDVSNDASSVIHLPPAAEDAGGSRARPAGRFAAG